jgi:hypothetical protein
MALTSIPLPYGLRDIKLRGFTDAGATTPAGSSVDLPYARTMSFSEAEDFEELRGDDGVVTTRGKGPAIDWEIESGGISLPAYAIIAGGIITASGTTPNQVNKYRKLSTDTRPFFKMEGQVISDSGGDFHGLIYRARATGDLGGEFGDGQFFLTGAEGRGLGSFEAATLNALYDLVQNESVTAATA